MKKLLFVIIMLWATSAQAQHIGVAANLGSNGIGIDVATTLSSHLEMRVGWDAMSRFTTTTHLYTNELSETGLPLLENEGTKIDFDARSNMKGGKLLVDFFPNKNGNFRITMGFFYATNAKVAQAINTSHEDTMKEVYEYNKTYPNDKIGVSLGNYFLEPDEGGHIHAAFHVNRIQPYLGIGWGRSVPKAKHFSVGVDLGLKYWGKPSIYCNEILVPDSNMNGSNRKVLKTLSNLSVWPVLNVRVAYRLF